MTDRDIERTEALEMRMELSDLILALHKEDKELYEFKSIENDYIVLSMTSNETQVNGLQKVSHRLEQMCISELIAATSVVDAYFKEEDEEIAMYAGEA